MRKLMFLVCLVLFSAGTWAQNFPFPQSDSKYKYGITASNPNNSKIQSLYKEWVSHYYEESGNLARIKFDTPGETVSEGIGYGMLILVYMDNSSNKTKEMFDKLYNYYQKFSVSGGYLMSWKINGFSGVANTCGSNGCQGSATDGDLDVALALCLAAKQWGDQKYITEAGNLLSKIYSMQIENNLIKPGHHWNDSYNPCYFTTASIGVFKQAHEEFGFSGGNMWGSVYDACQTYLKNAQGNSSAGFYPDWTTNSISAGRGSMGFDFSWDACRTPWRVAWDYVWYGNATAKQMSDKTINWASSKSVGSIKGPMDLAGNPLSDSYHNVCFYGGIGSAFMASQAHQSNLDQWYDEVANGAVDYTRYYAATVQILYMLTMSGNMPNYFDAQINTGPQPPRYRDGASDPDNNAKITLTFSSDLSVGSANSKNDFTFKVGGQNVSVAGVTQGSDKTQLVFELAEEIPAGKDITVSYSGSSVSSAEGVAMEAFQNREVANSNIDGYLIADCESGPETALSTGWFTYTDGDAGGASTVTPLTTDKDGFKMTAGGAAGTDNAAKIEFKLNRGSLDYDGFVGVGFNLTTASSGYDMSEASGIAFWHKGEACFLEVVTTATSKSGCNFYATVSASDDWELCYVKFDDLKQYDWGDAVAWDATKIMAFQWKVTQENSQGEVWIDEVVAVGMETPFVPADKIELNSLVANASGKLLSATAGDGHGQYVPEVISELEGALGVAQQLDQDPLALQEDVDAASEELKSALDKFNSAMIEVDFSALSQKIAQASEIKDNAVVGNGANEYPADAYDLFVQAIVEADVLVEMVGVLESEVAQMVDVLNSAIVEFESSKSGVSTAILSGIIATANEILSTISEGDGHQQATSDAVSQLKSVVADAEGVEANPASQDDVAAMEEQLQTAIDDFQAGVIVVDFTALSDKVAEAEQLVESAQVGSEPGQYSASAVENLTAVVAQSSALIQNPGETASSVSLAVENLSSAIELFKLSVNSGDNTGMLLVAIDAAKEILSQDIGSGHNQFPESASESLTSLIAQAEELSQDSPSDDQSTQMVQQLYAEIDSYKQSKVVVDFSELDAIINRASALSNGASIGTGDGEFPQEAKTKLDVAIVAATEINGTTGVTQSEADGAVSQLDAAIKEFEGSVTGVNVLSLKSLIETVSDFVAKAQVGNGHGQFTQESIAGMTNQIETATAVAENPADQSDADMAIEALQDAFETFESSDVKIDFSQLDEAVAQTSAFLNSAVIGNAKGEYPRSAADEFSSVIESSSKFSGTTGATDNDVSQKIEALQSAMLAFKDAVVTEENGNNNGGDVDVSELESTIASAQGLANQANVGSGHNQYSFNAVNDLKSAIDVALAAQNNSSSQDDVDNANKTLLAAIADFKESITNVDFSDLENVIAESERFAGSVTVGEATGEWLEAVVVTFNGDIAEARSYVEKLGVTQSEIATVERQLSESLAQFKKSQNVEQTGTTDFSELNSALSAAENYLSSLDGSVGTASNQYSSAAVSAYSSAIEDASAVSGNSNATQIQVNQAVLELQAAEVELEKSALENTITFAASESNTNIGDAEGQHPESAKNALQAKVEGASGVLSDNSATKTMVVNAKNDLLKAIDAFAKNVNGKEGNNNGNNGNPIVVPEGDLSKAIQEAEALLTRAQKNVGSKIGQYSDEDVKSFQNMINIAKSANANSAASQEQKNITTYNLKNAQRDFVGSALLNSLTLVLSEIENTTSNENSVQMREYVQTMYDEVYLNEESTEDELNQAVEDLIAEYNAFKGINPTDPNSVETDFVTIYPNPVTAVLNIKEAVEIVEVYNSEGKLVLKASSNTVDVSVLARGTYSIRAIVDGAVMAGSFVK